MFYTLQCLLRGGMHNRKLVLVDEPGRSVIVIVVVCEGQERFIIVDEIKWETEFFLWAWNLRVQSSGSGYFNACGGLRIHFGVWRSRTALEEKGWRHPLHTYIRSWWLVLPRTRRDMFLCIHSVFYPPGSVEVNFRNVVYCVLGCNSLYRNLSRRVIWH